MFRSAAVALLAASAVTAQPEITSEDGNLMVRSVQNVNLGDIEARLASTTYDATVGATQRMFTAMTQMNLDNQVATAGLQSTIDAAVANINSQMASQSAAMSVAMAANSAAMSTRISSQTAAVASQMAVVAGQLQASESAMISRSAVSAGETTT